MSEVTLKESEWRGRVIVLHWRKEERNRKFCFLTCSSIEASETALLITICSANIYQCDSSRIQDPDVPSGLATSQTYPHPLSH